MTKAFLVDARLDHPDISQIFLLIQVGIFTGLNVSILVVYLLCKFNPASQSVITGRPVFFILNSMGLFFA